MFTLSRFEARSSHARLGKPGSIVHIKDMVDETENTTGAAPRYRERTPDGAPHRPTTTAPKPVQNAAKPEPDAKASDPDKVTELGGPKGLEPTRFGDWERDGRCVDF